MCTVTLSYDAKNVKAQQALTALLSTGLFTQMATPEEDDMDIDYSDPWLYEDHGDLPPLPEGKESFTLEEAYELIVKDICQIYEKDAI